MTIKELGGDIQALHRRIRELEAERDDHEQARTALEEACDQYRREAEELRAEVERLRGGAEPVAWMDGDYITKGPVTNCPTWTPLYTHPPSAVPKGWKLVPVDPAEEMAEAWFNELERRSIVSWTDQYRAMLAAAPLDPTAHKGDND